MNSRINGFGNLRSNIYTHCQKIFYETVCCVCGTNSKNGYIVMMCNTHLDVWNFPKPIQYENNKKMVYIITKNGDVLDSFQSLDDAVLFMKSKTHEDYVLTAKILL